MNVIILTVRHPDSDNDYTISAPKGVTVDIIDADLGSSFDGKPEDEDEAASAVGLAAQLRFRTRKLPSANEVRNAARDLAAELIEQASDQLTDEEIRAEYRDAWKLWRSIYV